MFVALCILLVLVPAVVIATFPIHALWSFRRPRVLGHVPRVRRVSVIMPLAGPEENFHACIQALRHQQTSFDVEFVFAVEDHADPAAVLAMRGFTGDPRPARVVIPTGMRRDLGKMRNLMAGVDDARGDLLVFLDSDTVLDSPHFLERLVRDMEQPRTGMVTCVPAYRGARNVAASVLASTINHDLPGYFALFDCWTGLRTANGSCLAISHRCLSSIGGLQALRAQLLMDTKLAQRVVDAGWRVHLHAHAVSVPKRRVSGLSMWQQTQRWQTSMSRVLPAWQYAAFAWLRSGGVAALVLAAAAPNRLQTFSLACLAAYATARLLSAWLINALWIRDPAFVRRIGWLPVVELFNGVSAVASAFCSTVVWRGRRYHIRRNGTAVDVVSLQGRNSETAGTRSAAS